MSILKTDKGKIVLFPFKSSPFFDTYPYSELEVGGEDMYFHSE